MTKELVDRALAWKAIAQRRCTSLRDPTGGLDELPDPAARFLRRSLSTRSTTVGSVELEMEGQIKLRRWMPFRAKQILHPELGFVWDATVGRFPLRFVGGDSYWQNTGSLEFRLLGLIPMAKASGQDINRSAAGRLAAETVAWCPQALHPATGALWQPVDESHATVTRSVGSRATAVTICVDPDGELRNLVMERWGDPDESGRFGLHRFGATISRTEVFNGTTVAAEGSVGWHWGTDRQADGEFFRYRVTDLRPTGVEQCSG